MAAEDKISIGIGVLVPQIFYDMIARLVPGSVMFAVFALTYVGPNSFFETTLVWLTKLQEHTERDLCCFSGLV